MSLGKPKIIDVFNVTQNALSIRFLPDTEGLSKIKSWTLNADTTTDFYGQGLEVATAKSVGDRTIKIDRLTRYTKYYLRMFGSSSFEGDTPNSSITTVVTNPGLPGAPSPTYIDAQGTSGFHYKFNIPVDLGGTAGQAVPPFKLQIGYGTDQNDPQAIVDSPANGDIFVNGLKPYTTYYVWSRATNATGTGPWSVRYQIRTRAILPNQPVPKPATDIGMVSFVYSFLDGETNGPSILEKQIGYGTDQNVVQYTFTPGSNDALVGGLSPATTWYVWSRQRTEEGWSAWSERTAVRTTAGARVLINGIWREAIPFVKVNGQWKWAQPYARKYGKWYKAV